LTVEQIREVLNREDIEGLIALGAPKDEYDMEADMIPHAVAKHKSSLDGGSLRAKRKRTPESPTRRRYSFPASGRDATATAEGTLQRSPPAR